MAALYNATGGGGGSAQSLPRDLSLSPALSIVQRFAPELQTLRQGAPVVATGDAAWTPRNVGLQAELLAFLPASCAVQPGSRCGVSVLGDARGRTAVTLEQDLGLVVLNATSQGNAAVRGGPLPPPMACGDGDSEGWCIHVYADHAIVEVIVNNATALVAYAAPSSAAAGEVALVGMPVDASEASLKVWALRDAGHAY